VIKAEGRRALGKPRHRWEKHIKVELKNKTRRGQHSPSLAAAGCCEHGNQISDFLQSAQLLDYMHTC
jgi:hypothetical protein